MSSTHATPAPAARKRAITAATASFSFYDIEVLDNVFSLCVYNRRANSIDVFWLADDDGGELSQQLRQDAFDINVAATKILEENPAFQVQGELKRTIRFHDLSTWDGNYALARMFGISDAESVNDPDSVSTYSTHLRPACDTDPDFDPFDKHPYFVGFNSYNYDTTIFALYAMEAFAHLGRALKNGQHPSTGFTPAKASILRSYNNDLFTETYKKYMPRYLEDGPVAGHEGRNSTPNRIRQAMISSGRHIDAARLNEAQQMVALKRLLGMLGRQIKESEKLGAHNARVHTLADLYELLAYNVSDVVGLAHIFEHPTYSSNFDLKQGLLEEYPETIYNQSRGSYTPNIHPKAVRRGRLTPDSTSAKFVGLILSPYGKLSDIESVSFLYPSERVAKERGIPRVNVLDQCREFFYESISDPDARARFDEVYAYYKSIEGQNFNDSPEYQKTHPNGPAPRVLSEIPKRPNNLPYFYADGSPSTCFVTFSTGGIHGAEANWSALEEKLAGWDEEQALLQEVQRLYPDPLTIRSAKEGVPLSDGRTVTWKEVLTSKTRLMDCKEISAELEEALSQLPMVATVEQQQEVIQSVYDRRPGIGYKQPKARPSIFKQNADGSTKLEPSLVYTSMGQAIHEDFTSYYPNMLRNMSAFWNEELGEDRYAKILGDKDRYDVLRKDSSKSAEERARFNIMREGTKLILNAASGAGDMTFGSSPIRVNNQIISMRIIGQLFSWRIGQAQTLAGARIISTNTDGLYSADLDEETNNRVLAEQQARINVEIEPEPLIIVSKDSNNRLELEVPEADTPIWDAKILSASGGTLACHKGPQPTKSLAHPAVLDWALARYLRYIVGGYTPQWRDTPVSLAETLDRRLGKQLMLEAVHESDPVTAARLFQNMVVASNGKITIPFAADPVDPINPDPDRVENPRPLQHYNRTFVVHAGKPGAVSLRAAGAWVVNPASKLKRKRDNEAPTTTEPVALEILRSNGFARSRLEAAQEKRTLLPEDQDVAVRRITGIDPSWSIIVENRDLVCMDEGELRSLLGCLDLDIYLEMLASTFEKNWMNSSHSAAATHQLAGAVGEGAAVLAA